MEDHLIAIEKNIKNGNGDKSGIFFGLCVGIY